MHAETGTGHKTALSLAACMRGYMDCRLQAKLNGGPDLHWITCEYWSETWLSLMKTMGTLLTRLRSVCDQLVYILLPPFLFICRGIVQFYTIQRQIKRNGGSIW
jgi:hypothetical protein